MKRHASDARDDTRRSPDAKRQRCHGGYNNNYDAQRRYNSNDSYARRTDRYAPPPRHTDATQDRKTESERRDTREPVNARVSNDTSSSNGQPRTNNGSNSNSSNTSSGPASNVRLLSDAKETDPHRLAQRQKQIDYGKNTVGYDLYCAVVPRHTRRRGVHPMTPDRTLNVSKKAFDGMVRKWRQALHAYDPPELQSAAASTTIIEQAPALDASAQQTTEAAASIAGTVVVTSDSSYKADLDRERQAEAAAAPISHDAPRHSIYDNFVEDGDDVGDDDDDDDDDLL